MSREVRRVPLDFGWPMNQVWQGYLSPDRLNGVPCPDCNSGETWASRWLYLLCQRVGMLAGDVRDQAAGKPMHPWLAEDPYPPTVWRENGARAGLPPGNRYDVVRPSADIVDLLAGIAGVDPGKIGGFLGRDAGYDLYKAIVEASGIESWGACARCEGHGEHERYPGQRAEREAWEPTDPPSGDGWQLWETVSEGSPISQVFASDEALIVWLTTEYMPVTDVRLTVAQARAFVAAGYSVGSFVSYGGGPLVSGEAAVSKP